MSRRAIRTLLHQTARLLFFSEQIANLYSVGGQRGMTGLVSDRVILGYGILSGPSHPERAEPSRGPSYLDAPLEISRALEIS